MRVMLCTAMQQHRTHKHTQGVVMQHAHEHLESRCAGHRALGHVEPLTTDERCGGHTPQPSRGNDQRDQLVVAQDRQPEVHASASRNLPVKRTQEKVRGGSAREAQMSTY